MSAEELLEMLRGNGLDDEMIMSLLSDALASLDGSAEEAPVSEEEQASKLLGVDL